MTQNNLFHDYRFLFVSRSTEMHVPKLISQKKPWTGKCSTNNDISFYHLKENGREEKSIQFLTIKQELKLHMYTYNDVYISSVY